MSAESLSLALVSVTAGANPLGSMGKTCFCLRLSSLVIFLQAAIALVKLSFLVLVVGHLILDCKENKAHELLSLIHI